ncbi:MAG TPA: hydroxymethylbilane synthase [Candidatus Limnocylindria bacterium]
MTATATLRIGTRHSRLALAQAEIALNALTGAIDGAAELVPISTRGDAISARRPRAGWVATDGQFTRELERALITGEVDVVVHSYKDLPTAQVDGLAIGAVLERGDARDCLVTRNGETIEELPFGARIGTSSPRRAAQLAARRSDFVATPIRGNVETRLRRLADGEFDALILAAAGLDRLGIAVAEPARLAFELMLPAPAQAALALQVRGSDDRLRDALARVDHQPTRIAVEAERALLRRIGGGCLAPLGALADVADGTLSLRAAFEDETGELARAEASGPATDPDSVVETVARRLISR